MDVAPAGLSGKSAKVPASGAMALPAAVLGFDGLCNVPILSSSLMLDLFHAGSV